MEDLRARTTLFCGVLAFAIALSMLLRGRRAVHWLFAAFAMDVAFWYASQSLYGIFQARIWVRATAILTVLLPQFAVHLFQSVVPLEGGERRSRLTRVATFLGLPMLAIVLSPYHEAPLSLGLVYFYVFGLLAAALIALWLRGTTSPSRAVRDRVRFLVGVGAMATTFQMGDFLSYVGVALPPIGAVLATIFLFVLAESLTRPRLADLYEMAGRLLVATALAFALAGIFYGFITYIGRFGAMYLNAVLAAIVFLVLLEPLQNQVEKRIHQFFFRERYDLETIVTDLRRRLAHVLEIDEMVQTLLAGLETSRRVTSAAIYMGDQEGDGFDLAGSIGATAPKRIEALSARPLLDRLNQVPSISLEEIAREAKEVHVPVLTAASTLGALRSSVVLAVRGDDDQLVGLVCVADDRVKDAFTPEEVLLLETIGAQIGVAIANSRVYTRMKERDRLAALGAMAAGLAHEVKNPLGAIKGAAQLLEELAMTPPSPPSPPSQLAASPKLGSIPPPGDGGAQEFIGVILEEVNRLDRVVRSFLDYARPHAGNPIPLDVNAAVRRTVQILSTQTSEEVEVKLDLTEPLPRSKIDPEQFRQVLINLIQNAIQAMDGAGKVTVSTAHRRMRATWAGGSAERSSRVDDPGEVVEVSVRDTGPGITQTVLRNLFIPFFTTKERGTGLGLAISQSIVQNAGGTIHVQTQSGAGTTFTIVLPVATVVLITPAPGEKAADGRAWRGRRSSQTCPRQSRSSRANHARIVATSAGSSGPVAHARDVRPQVLEALRPHDDGAHAGRERAEAERDVKAQSALGGARREASEALPVDLRVVAVGARIEAPRGVGDRALADDAEAARGPSSDGPRERALIGEVHRALERAEEGDVERGVEPFVFARVGGDADLPGAPGVLERALDVVPREDVRVARVEVEDVDHVGAEAPERVVDAARDRLARPVGDAVHAVAPLRGERVLAPPVREVPPDPLLGEPVAARGVEERHAEIERRVQDPPRLVLRQIPAPHVPGAEAERGDA